jgi:uncharacterized membrane protein YhaH (DUF805 family)
MGPLPHLNFAPRWAVVRAAVAEMYASRFKNTAKAAVFGARATVVGAIARVDLARIKQSAGRALATAKETASTMDRAHIETAAQKVAATTKRAVRTGWPILREIADPRGRCNRKAFLTIALAFLAIQFAVAGVFWLFSIETDNTTNLLLNVPILWIGSTVCFKRLHDVGRSGWWLPGSFVIWFTTVLISLALISIALADNALDPGQPAFYVAFATITLPVFGALVWLHTAASVETANKYGPVAGPLGLSMPERKAAATAADVPATKVASAA